MSRLRTVLRRAAFAVLVMSVMLTAAAGRVDQAEAEDYYQINLTVVSKPDHLCLDRQARVVFIVDILVTPELIPTPLVPLQLRAIAMRGKIVPDRWSISPIEGTHILYVDYQATKEGHDDITFVAEWGGQRTTLDVSIDVFKCQYKVKVNGNQTWTLSRNQNNVEINQFYDGEGDFDLILDQSSKGKDIFIAGAGKAKWDFMMMWTSPVGKCATNSKIEGEATFRVWGSVDKDNKLKMDIVFEPGQHGGGVNKCVVQGKQLDGLPMKPDRFNIVSKNLKDMTLSILGDEKEFDGAPLNVPPWNTTENVYVSVRERGK